MERVSFAYLKKSEILGKKHQHFGVEIRFVL